MEQKPIVLFHTEEFSFEKQKDESTGKETVIISGNAQPLNEDSRNGVRYRPESVKKAYKSLMNCAFLFNHDAARSLGHIVDVGLNESHMTYRADVDPEEKDYIRKVERKDINHVSVGCMVKNIEWNEDEQIYVCDVKEYVELSAVTVPGFANTSATKEGAIFLANALGDNDVLEKLKVAAEKKKEADDEDDDKDKDKDKDKEGDDEDDDKDKDKEGDDEDDDEDEDCGKKKKHDAEGEETPEGEEETEEAEGDEPEGEGDETEEGLGKEEEDETPIEEQVSVLKARVEELFSKFDEVNNKVASFESKLQSLEEQIKANEEEEKQSLNLSPNAEETFSDDKKGALNEKIAKEGGDLLNENNEAKKKELLDEKNEITKKAEVKMKDVRLKNVHY